MRYFEIYINQATSSLKYTIFIFLWFLSYSFFLPLPTNWYLYSIMSCTVYSTHTNFRKIIIINTVNHVSIQLFVHLLNWIEPTPIFFFHRFSRHHTYPFNYMSFLCVYDHVYGNSLYLQIDENSEYFLFIHGLHIGRLTTHSKNFKTLFFQYIQNSL